MKKRIDYKVLLYCFLISLIILFFASKSSPFYPFNDWVDANAFLTVGKGLMKGLVPYKDLFEQKGPLLYLLFGLASLISETTFLGVFILEVIFMTFTMYFCYLICKMFLSKKRSLILLPIFLVLMVTTASFTHGSSCEEFMFLPQAISLYYFIRHFKEKNLSNKEIFINGFLAGIILLMKYTSLGFWFSFIFMIFINKEYKKGVLSVLYFLLGMIIPCLLTLIYFGINHGIKDFIHVYFIINMTSYSEKISIFARFIKLIKTFLYTLFGNNILVITLVLLYPIIIWFMKLKRNGKISLLVIYLLTILGVFYGLKNFCYYILPINFLMIISLIGLCSLLNKYKLSKYYHFVFYVTLFLSFGMSYYFSVNKYFHDIKKEDLFQYEFAEIIKKDASATMVNMGFLDCGIYTMSNILPSTYFFELQNFEYDNFKDNIDAFSEYIKNKETKYIVYIKKNKEDAFLEEDVLYQNYEIILKKDFTFENKRFEAYLWKVR